MLAIARGRSCGYPATRTPMAITLRTSKPNDKAIHGPVRLFRVRSGATCCCLPDAGTSSLPRLLQRWVPRSAFLLADEKENQHRRSKESKCIRQHIQLLALPHLEPFTGNHQPTDEIQRRSDSQSKSCHACRTLE